jgi:hypothetical protein
MLPGSGGGATSVGQTTGGIHNEGGRGGGIVIIASSEGITMETTCDDGGLTGCVRSTTYNSWTPDNSSALSALAHYNTRISADGESVFGGGGAGSGGSVWLRYTSSVERAGNEYRAPLTGEGLVSARGGETCYFPLSSTLSCVGQAEEENPLDARQGGTYSNPSGLLNATYHMLNHPGGVGAGGRIRLEVNESTFTGAITTSAGYSPGSTLAQGYLAGNRGTIVTNSLLFQDRLEPGSNIKGRDGHREVGIDIRFSNITAPIFPVQVIEIATQTGMVLVDGLHESADETLIGGNWGVSYKGIRSDKVLSSTATAKDVFDALVAINNTELRHINVNRQKLPTSTYDAATYAGDSTTQFIGGYQWRITFFDDQHSLSLLKFERHLHSISDQVSDTSSLFAVPGPVTQSILWYPSPITTYEAQQRADESVVGRDFEEDDTTAYYGKYSRSEVEYLISTDIDNLFGDKTYAYWRDLKTFRVVPGDLSDRYHYHNDQDLRNALYHSNFHRTVAMPGLLGKIYGLETRTMTMPTPSPTGQPTGVPTMQPSGQPTMQPSGQPTSQPSAQPTIQPTSSPTGQPSSQPTMQPSSQPTSSPTMQPSSQPTSSPSGQPSAQPSGQPTGQPSGQPSAQPTGQPSGQPSGQPTGQPTGQPSTQPSTQPSGQPTMQPSGQPTSQPSDQPTGQPTGQPTSQPSGQPSTAPTPAPV